LVSLRAEAILSFLTVRVPALSVQDGVEEGVGAAWGVRQEGVDRIDRNAVAIPHAEFIEGGLSAGRRHRHGPEPNGSRASGAEDSRLGQRS
jgi:hypothetical protein